MNDKRPLLMTSSKLSIGNDDDSGHNKRLWADAYDLIDNIYAFMRFNLCT